MDPGVGEGDWRCRGEAEAGASRRGSLAKEEQGNETPPLGMVMVPWDPAGEDSRAWCVGLKISSTVSQAGGVVVAGARLPRSSWRS